jgi:hypothetical protein
VASAGPDQSFKGRQFTAGVILWEVRWYLMFPISYRDLELMLADRGLAVDHTTIYRWTQAYAPEIEKRIRPMARQSGCEQRDNQDESLWSRRLDDCRGATRRQAVSEVARQSG